LIKKKRIINYVIKKKIRKIIVFEFLNLKVKNKLLIVYIGNSFELHNSKEEQNGNLHFYGAGG